MAICKNNKSFYHPETKPNWMPCDFQPARVSSHVLIFSVVWKRVKRRIRGRETVDFSIALAKIDRPGNSRYYFMLHPLSGVLHVKRKAGKCVVHIRSLDLLSLFYIWTALSIFVGLLNNTVSTRRSVVSYFSFRSRDKDEMMDQGRGSRYKISAMCRRQLRDEDVAQRCPRTRELLEYRLDGSRSLLNCTTRLNLHYPIVDTAPPSSAVPVRIDARD